MNLTLRDAHIMTWRLLLLLVMMLLLLCAPASPGAPARQALVSLRLNVPAYRLDVYHGDSLSVSYPVAVGERRYPTPTGSFFVTAITWNPWWYPPASDWARNDTIQPPNPGNPMGRVKLQIGALYFLHGTPFESSIGKAASHGCVRMRDADAQALARTLNRLAGGDVADTLLDRLEVDRSKTITAPLRDSVPIIVTYATVEVRDSRLLLHRDIYGRDPVTSPYVVSLLAAQGVDSARLDHGRIARLVRQARTRSVTIPLDSITVDVTAS
jgi:murein L,D-transpeptidase YcbB/YkuD